MDCRRNDLGCTKVSKRQRKSLTEIERQKKKEIMDRDGGREGEKEREGGWVGEMKNECNNTFRFFNLASCFFYSKKETSMKREWVWMCLSTGL